MTKTSIKTAYNLSARAWTEKEYPTHTYIEKPAVLKAVGDLQGKEVICIGCGNGNDAKLFKQNGATVVGFDFSKEMLKIARKKYPDIEFYIGDVETFQIDRTFDIAYSGFVAHYLPNWSDFLRNTSMLLKPKGLFVLSTVHPIRRASVVTTNEEKRTRLIGYTTDVDEKSDLETHGDYLNSHEVDFRLSDDVEVVNFYRPINEQLRDIIDSGFELVDFLEPKPIEEMKEVYPEKYMRLQKFPSVLIYVLRKRL